MGLLHSLEKRLKGYLLGRSLDTVFRWVDGGVESWINAFP
jgi:hypothetical protein